MQLMRHIDVNGEDGNAGDWWKFRLNDDLAGPIGLAHCSGFRCKHQYG
jgi:hypothetical protein